MNKLFSTFVIGNNTSITLILLFSLSVMVGCSQNQQWIKVDHPGKYDLIKMGKRNEGGLPYRITRAHNKVFYSYPGVLGPTYFSVYLLEHTEIHEGESVLDIGTGSGLQAIYAAEKANHVLAMDINEKALKNTLLNARRLGATNKISVRESDLFNALSPNEKFDVIISSIPYAWNANTQGNWKLHERFFLDVGKHLNPNGRIYFLTGSLKNLSRTKALIEENSLKIIRVDMAYDAVENLEPIVYVIKHTTAALRKNKGNS